MVYKKETVVDALEGIYEGELEDRIRAYSPEFHLIGDVVGFGRAFFIFNKNDPSLIEVYDMLSFGKKSAILIASYEESCNQHIIAGMEKAGFLLNPPNLIDGLDSIISEMKNCTSQDFEYMVNRRS